MAFVKSIQHTVPVLLRAIEIVHIIATTTSHRDISPKSLSLETGIPSVTCYRILRSLIAEDWIRELSGGGYELSAGFTSLSGRNSFLERLTRLARPELTRLSNKTKLTSKISIRCGDYAVTLCRCNSPEEMSISVREGAQFHLAYGSSGAVLLGQLSEEERDDILRRAPRECWKYQSRKDVDKRLMDVEKNGCCVDRGTYNPGYYAISVPIVLKKLAFQAALTVVGFPDNFTKALCSKLKKDMCETKRNVCRLLSSLSQ